MKLLDPWVTQSETAVTSSSVTKFISVAYTGDGTASRPIFIGFVPHMVMTFYQPGVTDLTFSSSTESIGYFNGVLVAAPLSTSDNLDVGTGGVFAAVARTTTNNVGTHYILHCFG